MAKTTKQRIECPWWGCDFGCAPRSDDQTDVAYGSHLLNQHMAVAHKGQVRNAGGRFG